MKYIVLFLIGLVAAQAARAENPCIETNRTQVCLSPATMNLTQVQMSHPGICVSNTLNAWTTVLSTNGFVRETTRYRNCPDTKREDFIAPTVVTNWYVVSGPGTFSASGSGLNASFAPTDTGSGTITFYLQYTAGTCTNATVSVSKTFLVGSPLLDSDYDGRTDCEEIMEGNDSGSSDEASEVFLSTWNFENETLLGDQGQTPLVSTNILWANGRFGKGIEVSGTNAARIAYREVESNGFANFNARRASVRFWFAPNWDSGVGPGTSARLLEIGSETSSNGWLGLILSPDGTQLSFRTATNNLRMTNLTATIDWDAGQWHQVVLTYSSSNSALYIDGSPVITNGTGVVYYPSAEERAGTGLSIGSDLLGQKRANGRFDAIECFNFGLTAVSIANHFSENTSLPKTNSCALYPIALHLSSLTKGTAALGASVGNFGWLNWDGKSPSEPELEVSLTPPGDSHRYNNAGDRIISIGDPISGTTGAKRSAGIKERIEYFISSKMDLILPVWNNPPEGQGNNYKYKVHEYAKIQLTGYNFKGNANTFYFIYKGKVDCDGSLQPPTVAITQPTNGAVFVNPTAIQVDASASTSNGVISQVEFFVNGTNSIGIDTSAPYSATWNNPTPGNAVLTAKATDSLGLSSISMPVVIGVRKLPTVAIVTPTNGAVLLYPTNLPVVATASDEDGIIRTVEFFYNGTNSLGVDEESPYTITWTNAVPGAYVLTAKATDNHGFTVVSAPVSVEIQKAPTIAIVAPTNGAVFMAPTNIAILAVASDDDGSVTQVEFHAGTNSLGVVSSTPFEITWTNPPAGNYTVTATATDNHGHTATSVPVSFSVQQGPTVAITNPTNNASFIAPSTLTVQATATDSDGTIASVAFYAGTNSIGSDETFPYAVDWSNPPHGEHRLTAIATDNHGHSTTSAVITVNIASLQNPFVTITSPTNGAIVVGPTNLLINASATDPDGSIAQVEFLVNGVRVGTDETAPYGVVLSNVLAGSYNLVARATDDDGLMATSAVVTVTVRQPPTIAILTPENSQSFAAPANIRITSIAEDVDGVVTNVAYYIGSSNVTNVVGSPFAFNWRDVPGGNYSLVAVATDNHGLSATSSVVNLIVVKQAPTVTITKPLAGSIFADGASVLIETDPRDSDGVPVSVELYNGGTNLAVLTTAPFNFVWTNATPAIHTLIAMVTDNDGLKGTSAPVQIAVQTCANPAILTNLSFSSQIVLGGSTLTAAVSLDAPAIAGGQAISIICTNPSVVSPGSVLVPEGQSSVEFTIGTKPVAVETAITISATYLSETIGRTFSLIGGTGAVIPGQTNTNDVVEIVDDLNFFTPEDLVAQIIGSEVEVIEGSIRYTGSSNAGGIFMGGGHVVGFDSGLVLSSGDVLSLVGTNDECSTSISNGTGWDEDLNRIVSGTSDAAVLEFGFVPQGEVATWEYVFGSEEYDDYSNSGYNDVFAFFVNGTNVAVLPDGSPVSINTINYSINTNLYRDNRIGDYSGDWYCEGSYICPLVTEMDGLTTVLRVSAPVIAGASNHIKIAIADVGDSAYDSVVMIRSGSFRTGGNVIYTRDDLQRTNFSAINLSAVVKTSASPTNSVFDLKSIDGGVVAARMSRSGSIGFSAGSRFDLQWGIQTAGTNVTRSYGPVEFNVQDRESPFGYDVAWGLPTEFYSNIENNLKNLYEVSLLDQISGLCGQSHTAQDLPHQNWPITKNILTVMVFGERKIAQGRCQDITLDDTNAPLNGEWDVRLDGEIVASSGLPNGWSVEADYTFYDGVNICAPANALIAPGYEVRLRAGAVARSGFFSVAPAGSVNTAPVLLPLAASSKVAFSNESVTVTVVLDKPAPGGGAYVSVVSEGDVNLTLPDYVLIPAGLRSNSFAYMPSSETGIKASYNGYRKLRVPVVQENGAPPGQPELLATGGVGVIALNWSIPEGADTYTVRRSVISGGPYETIFSGLRTNNFVDSRPALGVTNYYQVAAVNAYGEGPASAEAHAVAQLPAMVARPRIQPAGGVFNDAIEVTITTPTPTARIFYTTDGSMPTMDSFEYTVPFTISSSVAVRAAAFRTGYGDSQVATANFSIATRIPIECEQTNIAQLTTTNAYSVVNGPGYFGKRYTFLGEKGKEVEIAVSSADFDTFVYLLDPVGRVIAANDDISTNHTDSGLLFLLQTNGNYTVEVTSFNPEEVGNFTLSLHCASRPWINVYSNDLELFNYDVLEFGTNTGTKTVTLRVENSGSAILNLSSIAAYPTNFFTLSHTALEIPAGESTNLILNFDYGIDAEWQGLLVITNNVMAENPFYLNLRGEVITPAGPPTVSLVFPTNNSVIPHTPVNIELHATAYDRDGITNVVFYHQVNGTNAEIGKLTNAPYSMIWSNITAGNYILLAEAWDSNNLSSISAPVEILVGSPTLTLSTEHACVGFTNSTYSVAATVRDAAGGVVSNSAVWLNVEGPHSTNMMALTDANGVAFFTYTATLSGTDRIQATNSVDGQPLQSKVMLKNWAQPIECSSTSAAVLASSDGGSLACNCSNPARYGDFYTFSAGQGDVVRITMNSSNFSTFMFLMDTNCNVLDVTNEMLNATDTQVRFTVPTNGTYVIEATSADVFKTGDYVLKFECGAGPSAPDIAAIVSGTNAPSYTTIDLGVTTNGVALNTVITITNKGNSNLQLASQHFTLHEFSANLAGPIDLSPGEATNLVLQFLTTTSGRYLASLVLTNNDLDENPFVLHLSGISNPDGQPPSVSLLSPANGTRLVVPSEISLSAGATAFGAGVTITNVDFIFRTTQGAFLIGSDKTAPFSAVLSGAGPGKYTLQAMAQDSLGRSSLSAPIEVDLYPSTENRPPLPKTDTPLVFANSVNNTLDVLANDSDPDNDSLTIIAVQPPSTERHGTVEIINNGKAVRYTPVRNIVGYPADGFSYQVSDGKGGTAWAGVLVTVDASRPPVVQITSPAPSPYTTNGGAIVPIQAQVDPWTNIVKVEFYMGRDKMGEVTNGVNGVFTFEWIASDDCNCGITATAIDKFGQMGTSWPIEITVTNAVGSVPPVGSFDNLVEPVTRHGNLWFTNMATVEEGLFNLYGRAYHPEGSNVVWKLQLFSEDGEFLKDLTPAPLVNGFRVGAVGSPEGSNLLATCDFTLLPNDIYELRLMVRGGNRSVIESTRFRLESELKVGQFSFSEQDLVIPVNGIPLTVIRTYNSLNPRRGDFGVSWTYSINDMDIRLNEERDDEAISFFDEKFSLRIGGQRDVTLTLPDGRRATFAFYFEPVQCDAGQYGSFCLAPRWLAPAGIDATLETLGRHYMNGLLNRWQNNVNADTEWYDFPGFVLTTSDGTRYIIEREKQGDFFVGGDTAGSYYVTPYGPPYLSRIEQPSGNTIVISRDGQRASMGVSRIEHRDNTNGLTRAILFNRDNQGRIISVTDPNGQNPSGSSSGHPALRYEYDQAGNLSKVLKLVDRGAGTYVTNQYFYEISAYPHYLTRIVDARGYAVARNLYDDAGRLVGIIDAMGRTNRFEHDLENRRKVVYDRLNQPTVYQYDAKGKILSIVDPLGATNSFTYDSNGYRASSIDPLGNVTRYTNDVRGNITAIVAPHPVGADPRDYTSHYNYREDGLLVSTVSPTGAIITNSYDANGNLTLVRDAQMNVISSTAYNSQGLPSLESNRFSSINFEYDAFGNITKITNSRSQVITSGYDANGNITNLIGLGTSAAVEYDALNRKTSADFGGGLSANYNYEADGSWSQASGPTLGNISRSLDAKKQLTEWNVGGSRELAYGYNAEGQMQWLTNSAGVVTYTGYDAAGRSVEVRNLNTGASIYFGYNAAGRNTSITNALGYSVGYAYNPDGSIAAFTNEFLDVWAYSYDTSGGCCGGKGQTVTVTDPLGRQVTDRKTEYGLPQSVVWRSGSQVTSNYIEYAVGISTPQQEARDYVAKTVDEGGRIRRLEYTALGQIDRASDLSGSTWWTNRYNESGLITNVLSPTGETLEYAYNDSGAVHTIRFGDGGVLTNYYNDRYRIASNDLPSGVRVHFEYDDRNKLTNRVSSLGESAAYEYNSHGALVKVTDSSGTLTNLYDGAGRLYGINYSDGSTIRYQHDLLSRITAITNTPSASSGSYVTRYEYDRKGSITNVIDPYQGNTRYEYDRVGRRVKRVLPNNVVTTWEYDWRDRVTNLVHRSQENIVLASFAYERLPGGDPGRIVREDGSYVELQYDAAWKLTNEVYKTAGGAVVEEFGYSYDASGSRVALKKGATTLTNSVSAGYKITALKDASTGNTVESYVYDNGGRVTGINRDGDTLTLTYNAYDRLTSATNGSAWVVYQNDAAGRRIASTNSSGTTRRYMIGSNPGSNLENVQLISDQSGVIHAGFVYMGSEPILRFNAAGERVYYLEDAMGSIAALANDDGGKAASFAYDGFGNIRHQSGAVAFPDDVGGDFRFHRTWLDGETGLYHNRAREYDARLGRFTSRDPRNGVIQRPETINPYSFAVSNPYVFADPTGEFSVIEINVTGAMQKSLFAMKQIMLNRIRNEVKDRIYSAVSSLAVEQLSLVYPPLGAVWEVLKARGGREAGNFLEDYMIGAVCEATGLASFSKYVCFFPEIQESTGNPLDNGFNCENLSMPSLKAGSRYPDFVISEVKLEETKNGGKAIVIGDIKLSGNSLYSQYIDNSPGNKYYKGPGQFDAIARFAGQHTYTRVALFLTAFTGTKSKLTQVQLLLQKDALKEGVLVFIVAAAKNKNFDDEK